MFSVIIVAAGSSRRMGFDKLLAPLNSSTVLQETLNRFLETRGVSEIIMVCPSERFSTLKVTEQVKHVSGGAERHHSVKAGLEVLSPDSQYVAIHDGARPLVTPAAILHCLDTAKEKGAATLARQATETIKRADDTLTVTESLSRDHLWFMETPQIFSTSLIKKAYEAVEALDQLVTDEVSALQLIGQSTTLVPSPCFNPKITYPTDLELAQKFF